MRLALYWYHLEAIRAFARTAALHDAAEVCRRYASAATEPHCAAAARQCEAMIHGLRETGEKKAP